MCLCIIDMRWKLKVRGEIQGKQSNNQRQMHWRIKMNDVVVCVRKRNLAVSRLCSQLARNEFIRNGVVWGEVNRWQEHGHFVESLLYHQPARQLRLSFIHQFQRPAVIATFTLQAFSVSVPFVWNSFSPALRFIQIWAKDHTVACNIW